jgi:FkbM family methyltransferase
MLAALRNRLSRFRRTLFEAGGSDRYSRPALHGLDRRLERYLDFDGGFFIEAGANDGFAQSNTYYFEKLRNWSGILVEPIPELFAKCRALRQKSFVLNAALVSPEYAERTIQIHYADLMSVVSSHFESSQRLAEHLAHAQPHVRDRKIPATVTVPAFTLNSVLEARGFAGQIDLLSLDLEGYEVQALKGLDFSRYKPRFICVEVRNDDLIHEVLDPHYERIEVLAEHGHLKDVLFRARS